MSTLSDALTPRQLGYLVARTYSVTVDQSPIYPGCFIARDKAGATAAGRSARLAIEALEKRLGDD